MSYFAHVTAEEVWALHGWPGFVPVHRYDGISQRGEVGSIGNLRFIVDGEETTEFVTTKEFESLMRQPGFVRESPIQGRISNTTFISLVPPEAP